MSDSLSRKTGKDSVTTLSDCPLEFDRPCFYPLKAVGGREEKAGG